MPRKGVKDVKKNFKRKSNLIIRHQPPTFLMSKVSRKKVMIYDEMRLISLQSAILAGKIAFENNELFL